MNKSITEAASFVRARLADNGYEVPETEVSLALSNYAALIAPLSETREEWFVLGHPAWPMGVDFRTQAEAESFYWRTPKLDGTRDGMRVMHRTITRYRDYVPQPSEPESSPDVEVDR